MDWPLAINRNRDALQRIIALLFAMAAGGAAATLPRHVYRAVLLVLRPAESAVRRLVIIAARGLVLAARAARAAPAGLVARIGVARVSAFLLIDPLKRFTPDAPAIASGPPPRISVPGLYDPLFLAPPPVLSLEDPISAARLCRRLHALKRALDNLPRQARRLARWQARRDFALAHQTSSGRLSPFRPGRPPGHRTRAIHEIDEVLRECHGLALEAYSGPDTS